MTPKEKSTLIKAGLGLGAVVWAGPQILGMLFVLLFLGMFATLFFFAVAGTLLKYALIAACVLGVFAVLGRLVNGPKRREARMPADPAARRKRLEKASLDLELAKAMRDARQRQ